MLKFLIALGFLGLTTLGFGFDQADLDNFLANGVCVKCDLTDADLSNLVIETPNLNKTDLSGANLSGSDFTGGNFNKTICVATNFTDAILTDANFNKSNLTDADFTGANIDGVNFNKSIQNGTIF